MRAVLLGLVGLALVGCVSAYVEPAASTSTASIVFQRHPSVPRWGHAQALEIVADERCSERRRVKDFVPLGNQEPHAFRVEAGRRQHFHVTTSSTGGAVGQETHTCSNVVSFNAEVGGSYVMSQSYLGARGCAVEITDAETGRRAPEFTAHAYDNACVSIW